MAVPIDVGGCWEQYAQQSQANAEEINSVIDQFPWATGQLAQRFAAVMQQAKQANLCPFVEGNGPIIEESNAVLQAARQLAQNPPPPPQQAGPPGMGPGMGPDMMMAPPKQGGGLGIILLMLLLLGGVGAGVYFFVLK